MATPSILIVPDRYKSGVLYSQLPETGAVDFGVTRATPAFRTNASGVSESVASGVPRLDYPAAGGCPALLVEPAATNQIRNNSMQGAVTGTPGTLPTNYSTVTRGLSRSITNIGTENGVDFIDVRFSGTANITDQVLVLPEPVDFIAASTGQTWTSSAYFSIIASPQPPNSYRIGVREQAGTSILAQTNVEFSPTGVLTRVSATRTLSNISTTQVAFSINFPVTNGQAYDFTIRIGWPQMEQSSVATSPILTTTAAVTRNADVISKTGVSGFIGQTEGTIYAEVDLRALSLSRIFVSLGDSVDTIESRIRIGILSNNIIYSQIGNVLTNTITATTGVFKIALAYNSAGFVAYVNGTSYGTETTATAGTKSVINFGSTQALANFLNDRIRAAAIYTTRLSNTELAALTSL
jgi:hypothetical protein